MSCSYESIITVSIKFGIFRANFKSRSTNNESREMNLYYHLRQKETEATSGFAVGVPVDFAISEEHET
jgi:hypothetical protein